VQVNAVLSHPTLPAIITAQENGRIRFFDAKSCEWREALLIHSSPRPSFLTVTFPFHDTCGLLDTSIRSPRSSLNLFELPPSFGVQHFKPT
jgi:striatin 1/3/4